MSTRRSTLRHPLVVTGTALGLVVVGALNLHTFAPGGRLLGLGGGRVEAHLTPPGDLEAVVGDAVRARRDGLGFALAEQGAAGTVVRDPFADGPAPAPTPPAQKGAQAVTPRRAAERELVCTAVLLGGKKPLAMFGDEVLGTRDRVRGHEILAIDAEGVRLRRPDGSELTVTVGPGDDDTSGYHVVTGLPGRDGHGATHLRDRKTDEGTER